MVCRDRSRGFLRLRFLIAGHGPLFGGCCNRRLLRLKSPTTHSARAGANRTRPGETPYERWWTAFSAPRWGDDEGRPALPRHEAGQSGDECSVGPGEPGACYLAAKHGQLPATYQDLRILGDGVHVVDGKELDGATDQAIEEAEGHGVAGSRFRSCMIKPTIALLDPTSRAKPRASSPEDMI